MDRRQSYLRLQLATMTMKPYLNANSTIWHTYLEKLFAVYHLGYVYHMHIASYFEVILFSPSEASILIWFMHDIHKQLYRYGELTLYQWSYNDIEQCQVVCCQRCKFMNLTLWLFSTGRPRLSRSSPCRMASEDLRIDQSRHHWHLAPHRSSSLHSSRIGRVSCCIAVDDLSIQYKTSFCRVVFCTQSSDIAEIAEAASAQCHFGLWSTEDQISQF